MPIESLETISALIVRLVLGVLVVSGAAKWRDLHAVAIGEHAIDGERVQLDRAASPAGPGVLL
ncbi:MAG TPA: hypothetical protein VG370_13125 [Chloroflexota bacterium]|jgi:hypothetical protein|nr:hypothetical protein [Chloroflexota bacterium]